MERRVQRAGRDMRRASLIWTVLAGVLVLSACSNEAPTIEMEILTPEQGLSLHIPPFEVAQGAEVQDCYFITMPRVGDDDVLWVDRVRIGLNPGSHHFNMYRVTTETALNPESGTDVDLDGIPAKLVQSGPCLDSSNFNEWPLVVNSQQSTAEDPYFDWALPDGVAFPLREGEVLMLQPHYVNVSLHETPGMGQVRANFYRADDPEPIELGTLFATQQSIRVCRSTPDVTYYSTCAFPTGADVRIAAVNGHFHLRGRHFSIASWDGMSLDPPPASAEFYTGSSWSDPEMVTGLDIPVADGGGIWWQCQYEWREPTASCDEVDALDEEHQDDCCYTFGPRVALQEHCNVFLYYWPRVADTDIFCN